MAAMVILTLVGLSTLLSEAEGFHYRGRKVGGRTEVKNVSENKEVQDLGRFSVQEFNRRSQIAVDGGDSTKYSVAFSRVVAAEKQVVAGLKYYLKIETTTWDGSTRMFDSVVVVKPWLHSKLLLHFAPADSYISS